MINDISGLELPKSGRSPSATPIKGRSKSVDRAALKKKAKDKLDVSQTPDGERQSRSVARKQGMNRPVAELFNSSKNSDKFCRPVTLATARLLETDIEKLKRELKELRLRHVK